MPALLLSLALSHLQRRQEELFRFPPLPSGSDRPGGGERRRERRRRRKELGLLWTRREKRTCKVFRRSCFALSLDTIMDLRAAAAWPLFTTIVSTGRSSMDEEEEEEKEKEEEKVAHICSAIFCARHVRMCFCLRLNFFSQINTTSDERKKNEERERKEKKSFGLWSQKLILLSKENLL